MKVCGLRVTTLLLLFLVGAIAPLFSEVNNSSKSQSFDQGQAESLLPIYDYPLEPKDSVIKQILYRAETNPVNVISTLIFAIAVIHILCSRRILAYARELEVRNEERNRRDGNLLAGGLEPVSKSFISEIVHFLGEVEIIFGLWVIPLLIAITWSYNWQTAIDYLNSRDYVEAMVVVVIMVIVSTYPISRLAEQIVSVFAAIGNDSPAAWWFAILTIGPILGCFITEAGAMIISCVLLSRRFFCYKISYFLSYATIGLLFTNVSLGGIITVFASPPALLVSEKWEWSNWFMFQAFGWKSIASIILGNLGYLWFFRKEFDHLRRHRELSRIPSLADTGEKLPAFVPLWVTVVSLLFFIAIITHLHEPVVFIGAFLFFLGFYQATHPYQTDLILRPALLVGFFIAGLVIHAGLQEWWIAPLLDSAGATTMMVVSLVVGPFTDNAALTYLATLIPNLGDAAKYGVMVGAVATGGITVIANAPNPAGQKLLFPYFKHGVSARNLFLGAAFPAAVAISVFYIFFG